MEQRHRRNSVSFVVFWLQGTFQPPAIFELYDRSGPTDRQFLWESFLVSRIPLPADSEHIDLHAEPSGFSQRSEAQGDAIAQWRSVVSPPLLYQTPSGPLQPGFLPDSEPEALG